MQPHKTGLWGEYCPSRPALLGLVRGHKDNYCFDIQHVLETQVNDQKTQRQLTAAGFLAIKPAVVNYRWGYFRTLLVFLGSFKCQKSNCWT